MTIDNEGNVYLTGNGVSVFDPTGSKIAQIDVPRAGRQTSVLAGKIDILCSSRRAKDSTIKDAGQRS